MLPVIIRGATSEDYPAMAFVWDTAQAMRRQDPPPDAPTAETHDLLQKRADKESPRMLVAEDQGHVVGVALALQARKQDETNAIMPGLLHISMVGVLPQYWGRGIASALVDEILTTARGTYSYAQLWTQLTNTRAHDLYIRLGFTVAGERKIDDRGEEIQLYIIPLT